MVQTVTASTLFFCFTFTRFHLLVTSLRELVTVVLKPPLRPKFRARWGLAIHEAESRVFIGVEATAERIIGSEVEGGVGRIIVAIVRPVRVVVIGSSPVGDTAEFVRARKGCKGDVDGVVGEDGYGGVGGLHWTPAIGVEGYVADFETYHIKLVLGGSVKTAMAPPAVTTTLVTPKSNPPILRNPRTIGVNPDVSPQDSNLRPPLGKPRTIAKRPGDHLRFGKILGTWAKVEITDNYSILMNKVTIDMDITKI
ncbi:hypothetical protein LXL04_034491 [Taraxacum kok-saghyz]